MKPIGSHERRKTKVKLPSEPREPLPPEKLTLPTTSRIGQSNLVVIVALAACLAAGFGAVFARGLELVLVAVLCLFIVALGFLRQQALVIGILLVWLPFLGLLRRLIPEPTGTSSIDLLLVVGPVATVVLLLATPRVGAAKRTLLAGAILAFNILTLLSALNPYQAGPLGGLSDLPTHLGRAAIVGFSGLFFLFLPLLWFWIGRGLLDSRLMNRLLTLLPRVAVLAAVYGLSQTLFGFTSWDEAWIESKGYESLNVLGTTRPFGTFSSSTEYATFTAIGLVALWTTRRRVWTPFFVSSAIILVVALVLASARIVVVLSMLAIAATVSAKRSVGPWRALLFGAVGLIVLSVGLQQINMGTLRDPKTADLLEHQVQGLANPLDKEQSTLSIHGELAVSGLLGVLRHPLGYGAGAVTIAGSKFGGTVAGTEVDVSNAAVALGLPGLGLFLYIALSGLLLAYGSARARPDSLRLAALGILIVTALHWLNGGQYAVVPLPWLVLGWLDRQSIEGQSRLQDKRLVKATAKPEPIQK